MKSVCPSLRFPHALALVFLLTACGPVEEPSEPLSLGEMSQELASNNGLTPNGLAFNGLAFNGLAFNGLAFNGLAFNGLDSPDFATWFDTDPALANIVMRYMVQCAAPSGQTRTYTHGAKTYTWYGNLGLTPDWASGKPATELEQQLISSCLAAHVNKYGKHILISVLGLGARGEAISYTPAELNDFPRRESCFFGNLFTGEGLYAGSAQGLLSARLSTARACGLTGQAEATRDTCDPIAYIGNCHTWCRQDPTDTYYTECTYNGQTYRPVTTRLRKSDIYTCGDGVCQFTESCGTSFQYWDCKDCGPCP